ncbi:CinA family protein [Pseudoteredinibacter isoporae]|uniref:Nicotinamide-nucleotide amidase n=1 Tax=Pseudoteredinibacter isoporae TaxID=570281 RepID=A0A7X0JU86_9GAMM|nr:CinA family protein [Pseudoteredinibacter isoporae]MBB6521486.1 nicotinamide-nucleotide amidase [Pseudoteredinibacter isoporae]NHO87040.1 CinA family protein [Pseudoteredinibacter isoporae]NIB24507.1 CinA family protein [Pseudoteredinibacter isoporae]
MADSITALAKSLGDALQDKGLYISCAESCTGGGIASAITDIAGSSAWFEYGFVTYANEAKTTLLGVPEGLLQAHGAVSEEVVEAMAEGALRKAGADIALASSGIAGPGGGTPTKPVGTVWLAWAWLEDGQIKCRSECCLFEGDRQAVRIKAVERALLLASELPLLG